MPESIKNCWIVTEGIPGTENQCIGVAEALGVSYTVKRIKLRSPWRQLSPWLAWGHAFALERSSDPIEPPWPDLLITSGRKSVGIGLMIRKNAGRNCTHVHIQDPRVPPALFDLVAVPQHDRMRGKNVVVTTAALHRVTPQRLAAEGDKWRQRLSHLPPRRVAVIIGGNSRAHTMTHADTSRLIAQLQSLAADGATGLMVTVSRRTGETNARRLREGLQGKNIFFWDGQGDNPYFGFLALADYIIVTEDSVSMTSEAVSTGKPVYTAPLTGGGTRLDRFHALLQKQGFTRPFTGILEDWSYETPNDTLRVAQAILKIRKLEG